MNNPLAADLDYIVACGADLWEDLRGARLFVTGGTGFFGCWLLESLVWANDRLGLNAAALILSRRPAQFAAKRPHLAAHPALEFAEGDVRSFPFPTGSFSHVIHAATDASAALNQTNPLLMLDTITEGTRRALHFARECGASKFLLTSSGAVYGRQPAALTHVSEEYTGGPDLSQSGSAYGEGKRLAELYGAVFQEKHGLAVKIARCFAFVGPFLPLDTHFAIGNFIRDGLRGGPVVVGGDGTPVRSYLYGADLAIWLWTILLRGTPGRAYNVGAEEAVTIAELAHTVAAQFPEPMPVHIARGAIAGQPAERYVPSTKRAREELGLSAGIGLAEAVRRTISWNRLI